MKGGVERVVSTGYGHRTCHPSQLHVCKEALQHCYRAAPGKVERGTRGDQERAHRCPISLFTSRAAQPHTTMPGNPDVPLWLQLDFSIVMLSKKVRDVVLTTEAEGHKSCFHLP